MTAIDLTRAVHVERGGVDSEPPRKLVQSVHRALRVMVERGEMVRFPVEDGMSQWAFELVAVDALPVDEARASIRT